jgi:pimeloyl-ACP methyl ester carboxylesterase
VSGSATTALGFPVTGGALAGIAADRDRLSHLLRGLAAELDGLDRRLSDINWLRARSTGSIEDENPCERTALEAQREQITARLHVMAGQLSHLDVVLSDLRGHDQIPNTRVGTCPHCGYPSLGSGWCAYCRPHLLAR